MSGLLDGRSVLVTGASAGIGATAARRFAEEGARVTITARRQPELDAVVAAIEAAGGEAQAVVADATDGEALQRAVDAAVARFGRLDGALNNAGRSQGGRRLAEVPEDVFDAVVGLNLKGVWLAMRAELPAMVAAGGGAIVNVSSVGGTFGAPEQSVYGATKAAVVAMSRAAAVEYGRDGVRVNAIAPGATMTDMMTAWQQRDASIVERVGAMTALGRVGRPEEVAEAATWLLSDRASYVTGMTLGVDGGSAPWPH